MQAAMNRLLSIGADVPLEAAIEMMIEYGVYHLPVRRDGIVVGSIVFDDLGSLPGHLLVAQVMRRSEAL